VGCGEGCGEGRRRLGGVSAGGWCYGGSVRPPFLFSRATRAHKSRGFTILVKKGNAIFIVISRTVTYNKLNFYTNELRRESVRAIAHPELHTHTHARAHARTRTHLVSTASLPCAGHTADFNYRYRFIANTY
jgi:hypothetical protein